MSKLNIPCSKCKIPLGPYYLKDGMCNGCRNPHLIVEAIPARYNGWTNYETWNVALCIQNDEKLYNDAKRCRNYDQFVESMRCDFNLVQTPDRVAWDDPKLDIEALDQLIGEL